MQILLTIIVIVLKVHSCTNPTEPAVVGGQESKVGQFPFTASLQVRSSYYLTPNKVFEHICGATILNPKWILTAAHCLQSLDAESLRVAIGVHQMHSWTTGMTFHSVKRYIIHPNFAENTPLDDIALILIVEEIDFQLSNWLAKRSVLPEPDYNPNGLVTAMGWGDVSESGPPSDVLLSVELPIKSTEYCQQRYGKDLIKDTVFCAGADKGKDTCPGDSGGPVTQLINNNWVLVGIVSLGQTQCGQSGWPGVYTKVSKYLNWINDNIN